MTLLSIIVQMTNGLFRHYGLFPNKKSEFIFQWLFQLGIQVASESYVYPFGIFWHCKIDKILSLKRIPLKLKIFRFLFPKNWTLWGTVLFLLLGFHLQ